MSERKTGCRLGLDIGTSRIVLAARTGEQPAFHAQLNAFVRVPFSPFTARVFAEEKIPHTACDGEVVVYGNESEVFANLLHVETRRPMLGGMLNPAEPDGAGVLRQIVASLLESAGAGKGSVRFSLPAPPGVAEDLKYHESVVRQTLAGFGFDAEPVNEGLAVVYGELADSNYTGIGVSCGGGLTNICLAYLSVPVATLSVARAGDFIDASAASATGELATRVRHFKERGFSLGERGGKIQQALTIYYEEMIAGVVEAMRQAFSRARVLPRLDRPVPLVLAGGSVLPAGFRDRFEEALRAVDFPLEIAAVRLASDPLHATAKGALMAAEAGGETARAAAA